MNWRTIGAALAAVSAGWLWAPAVEAHLRDYLVSQPYYTAKRGEFEVELFNDVSFKEADNDDSYSTKHQLELEYGITDHFQLAYYEVYAWNRTQDWERDQFKIEAKYRLAEPGQWPLDVTLYTEYKNPDGSRERRSDAVESKLILSKDIGLWNVVANAIVEKDINTHSDWELAYTAGISYGLTPRTRVGLEVKQQLGTSDEFRFDGTQELLVVPGIYTSLTPHVRILFGPAFGMTRASDDLQLRSIVEVEF